MPKIRAIILDYDFTLVDSSKGIHACASYAMEQLKLPRPNFQALTETIGHTLEDTFTLLTKDSDPGRRIAFKEHYLFKADQPESILTINTSLLPHAENFLRTLNAISIKLAIVTTKTKFALRDGLIYLGIEKYFDYVQGKDDVKQGKPDPEGILNTLKELKLEHAECIYVGDNIIDAMAAKNANVAFVGLTTGTTSRQSLSEYPHIAILENLNELLQFLSKENLINIKDSAENTLGINAQYHSNKIIFS